MKCHNWGLKPQTFILPILEARSPRSRCRREPFLAPPSPRLVVAAMSFVPLGLQIPPVFTWHPPCVCLCPNAPFYKDTSHSGVVGHLDLSSARYICSSPVCLQIRLCPRRQGLGLPHETFRDLIQPRHALRGRQNTRRKEPPGAVGASSGVWVRGLLQAVCVRPRSSRKYIFRAHSASQQKRRRLSNPHQACRGDILSRQLWQQPP